MKAAQKAPAAPICRLMFVHIDGGETHYTKWENESKRLHSVAKKFNAERPQKFFAYVQDFPADTGSAPEKAKVEIRVRLDDLLRRLAELGPVKKIKDPHATTSAQLMEQMLTFVARNLDGSQPDEQFQRRMLDAAANEYHQLTEQLQWVPVLKERKRKKENSAKGSKAGGEATKKKYAKPALDDLIRGALARKERMRVKAWATEFGVSKQTIYNARDRVKAES